MELQATAQQNVVTVNEETLAHVMGNLPTSRLSNGLTSDTDEADCIDSSIDFAVGRDSTGSLTQSVLHEPIDSMEQQETNEAESMNLDSYQSPRDCTPRQSKGQGGKSLPNHLQFDPVTLPKVHHEQGSEVRGLQYYCSNYFL